MLLSHIERGTRLQIQLGTDHNVEHEVYEAFYYDMYDFIKERTFIVQCSRLNRNYGQLNRNAPLEISYTKGLDVYSFTGRAVSKMYSDMVVIEQLTDIIALNRRIYQRDEIHFDVKLYGLSEDKLSEKRYITPAGKPVLSDVSFDVSAGGICIVTNSILKSECDPNYLAEFALSVRDQFLLPSRVVRKSNFARSRIGKYDYGFQFIFENMPDERGRLINSILTKKLSFL